VAIKLLAGEVADAAARRRFQQEARLASSLNHPHILTVLDAGEWEGREYLVAEYLDGKTLRDWVSAEKRTWRQVVELLVGVADGLATAHAAGILHGDIKPGNILIHSSGYAKLADFGSATLEEAVSNPVAVANRERPTSSGPVMGTIPYVSPEQAAGKQVDARSDVFSFGIVLHEMLVGQRPFSGASDLEVLQQMKADEKLSMIPVVVLTSSREEKDMVASYKLGVNAYVVKPVDFHEFTEVVQTIQDFWLSVVTLPPVHPE